MEAGQHPTRTECKGKNKNNKTPISEMNAKASSSLLLSTAFPNILLCPLLSSKKTDAHTDIVCCNWIFYFILRKYFIRAIIVQIENICISMRSKQCALYLTVCRRSNNSQLWNPITNVLAQLDSGFYTILLIFNIRHIHIYI